VYFRGLLLAGSSVLQERNYVLSVMIWSLLPGLLQVSRLL
jgi:hypothetical protein